MGFNFEMQGSFNQTQPKELKENTKWKSIPCTWIGRRHIVRGQYYPK